MNKLFIVIVLTALIHLIDTMSYAVRPAGVTTRRLAISYSLYNVLSLVGLMTNMWQGPLLSSIIENDIKMGKQVSGSDAGLLSSPIYQHQLSVLDYQIRTVILGATLGVLIGAILIPVFIMLFSKWILLFEQVKSVPKMFLILFLRKSDLDKIPKKIKMIPQRQYFKEAIAHKLKIPRKFLALNIIVEGIYATGVLSSLYAGALFPEFRTTTTLLSGIINGIAAVLFATTVDPTAAGITDQAIREERPLIDINQMSFYLAVTRLLGTFLAQLIFIPSAWIIKSVAQLIV